MTDLTNTVVKQNNTGVGNTHFLIQNIRGNNMTENGSAMKCDYLLAIRPHKSRINKI